MADYLTFKKSYRKSLAKEIEKLLDIENVEITRQFVSWDSFSFLVEIHSKPIYVAKIFKFPNWPTPGHLESVFELLSAQSISHENIVHLAHKHDVFPYGWQLSEFIPGGNAKDHLKRDDLNRDTYFRKTAEKLKKVHEIKLEYFGSLTNPKEQFKTYAELIEYEIKESTDYELASEFKHYSAVIDEIVNQLSNYLSKHKHFSATVVHNDVSSSNIMWNDGDPVIIDWVDALAAPPLRDFATLTYRKYHTVLPELEEGYGKTIDRDELRFHQFHRFLTLAKYYYETNDIYEFESMMYRAGELLERDIPFGCWN
ncbi:aminoglycoside phosphotransferase family protein [candidate division WWE3 bacterium]|uniref:Aminoglycoside phosphotransferase family protein n=1 Tax=candidate division WWE3 bacterium TaxID=2053526 RepID=A0A955LMA0_UNCKA|nr:aminoglycoside phosphotransferase family protein [candidate division WWE3 bacterium]